MLHDLYGFFFFFYSKNLPIDRKKTFNGEKAPSVYRFCS